MNKVLHLRGVIRDVKYRPQLRLRRLKRYALNTFDINSAANAGIIDFDEETVLPYSKWISPKPSRSYPSASMYKIYHLPKPFTIIPILKDEGSGSQNNDRITYTTYSRMNLLNIYVILAWYESAEPHHKFANRIKNQLLNSSHVVDKIHEVMSYKQSALHWNRTHFKRDFERIYRRAVQCYQAVGRAYDLEMNSAENHLTLLDQYLVNGKFSLEAFAKYSSPRSASAAKREALTLHELEHLSAGDKGYFELKNLLGGEYHITADEVYWEDDRLVIQESKNSTTAKLPGATDIQDGLFKNILFHSIDELYLGDQAINFVTRLKLTGAVIGELKLPAESSVIDEFSNMNKLKSSERKLIIGLNLEATNNTGLSIEIATNK